MMDDSDGSNVEALVEILTCAEKTALAKLCASSTIYLNDLVDLGRACSADVVPLRYGRFFRRDHPEHLVPKDEELSDLVSRPVGPWAGGDAPKAMRKLMQSFVEQRRSAAHVFVGPGEKRWHFFHFNQRDVDAGENHWRGGQHVHLISWLTHPNDDWKVLVAEFKGGERPPHGGLHLKCVW
jgi:hypothetical protein